MGRGVYEVSEFIGRDTNLYATFFEDKMILMGFNGRGMQAYEAILAS